MFGKTALKVLENSWKSVFSGVLLKLLGVRLWWNNFLVKWQNNYYIRQLCQKLCYVHLSYRLGTYSLQRY